MLNNKISATSILALTGIFAALTAGSVSATADQDQGAYNLQDVFTRNNITTTFIAPQLPRPDNILLERNIYWYNKNTNIFYVLDHDITESDGTYESGYYDALRIRFSPDGRPENICQATYYQYAQENAGGYSIQKRECGNHLAEQYEAETKKLIHAYLDVYDTNDNAMSFETIRAPFDGVVGQIRYEKPESPSYLSGYEKILVRIPYDTAEPLQTCLYEHYTLSVKGTKMVSAAKQDIDCSEDVAYQYADDIAAIKAQFMQDVKKDDVEKLYSALSAPKPAF